ncbi:BA75_01370T0 [Komagataella pastoris]|uniref:5-demethoxyubiquinone hydroxylase, mitochondrial n=1 Tax=Komagataella pastoris TaxID=4922 RepID=A0A1B2J5L4_PICPA|nr:BA75_01370T0 [Komagataella pastoris]
MIRNSRNLFKLQLVRYTSTKGKENFPTEKMKPGYFSDAQNAYMDRVIRVDQAGELGANYIYNGQYLALSHKRPDLKPILKHMWEQEIHHHNTFNNLQVERRVRPSLLTPLWKVGAMGLGIATGLMGKEAAMACTEAVETVIGGHYNQQLRVLTNQFHVDAVNEETGETTPTIPEEIKDMQKLVSEFRDEELEHLDTAVEHDAHGARPYWLLTEAIKLTCRGAIWTAERV